MPRSSSSSKYALVENGVVIQTDIVPREGFIECPDYVTPGYLYDGETWSLPPHDPTPYLHETIKDECQRRIKVVGNQTGQVNVSSEHSLGRLSPADATTFGSWATWRNDMQTVCRNLMAANDETFREDRHWPEAPAGVADLMTKY